MRNQQLRFRKSHPAQHPPCSCGQAFIQCRRERGVARRPSALIPFAFVRQKHDLVQSRGVGMKRRVALNRLKHVRRMHPPPLSASTTLSFVWSNRGTRRSSRSTRRFSTSHSATIPSRRKMPPMSWSRAAVRAASTSTPNAPANCSAHRVARGTCCRVTVRPKASSTRSTSAARSGVVGNVETKCRNSEGRLTPIPSRQPVRGTPYRKPYEDCHAC